MEFSMRFPNQTAIPRWSPGDLLLAWAGRQQNCAPVPVQICHYSGHLKISFSSLSISSMAFSSPGRVDLAAGSFLKEKRLIHSAFFAPKESLSSLEYEFNAKSNPMFDFSSRVTFGGHFRRPGGDCLENGAIWHGFHRLSRIN